MPQQPPPSPRRIQYVWTFNGSRVLISYEPWNFTLLDLPKGYRQAACGCIWYRHTLYGTSTTVFPSPYSNCCFGSLGYYYTHMYLDQPIDPRMRRAIEELVVAMSEHDMRPYLTATDLMPARYRILFNAMQEAPDYTELLARVKEGL